MPSFPVAARLAPFGTSIFAEMTALAVKHNAVNLAQGFP
jgi:N-succinyldiaminopimelate aminotransferase